MEQNSLFNVKSLLQSNVVYPKEFSKELIDIIKPFELSDNEYSEISKLISIEMVKGLGKSTNLQADIKMLPSYVTNLPNGKENGTYLALDLGGTNYRNLLISFNGDGTLPKIDEMAYTIPNANMIGSGEQLFDFIADNIYEFLSNRNLINMKESINLGFTFSFPCRQNGLSSAQLLNWTKGFNASGVEGEDVVKLLQSALDRKKINAKCVALVNDTVGTLMACALKDQTTAIGLIVGTGTNAAYIEKTENIEMLKEPCKSPNMIINMEWGAFGNGGALDKYRNEFDFVLDRQSLHPGKQIFEKMVSGMYIGEIVRLVLLKLIHKKLILQGNVPETLISKNSFHSRFLSDVERDPSYLFYSTSYILSEELKVLKTTQLDLLIIRYVCFLVSCRAAFLVGAALTSVLEKIDRDHVTIAVDGSLFKFHPKFPKRMTEIIHRLKHNEDLSFVLLLSEDGSGKGAAAIAATA